MDAINISGIFGYETGLPLVNVKKNGETVFQFTTDKAREVALMLLECAEAATQDAFIFQYMKKLATESDVLNVESIAGMTLLEFRQYRDQLAGKF